MIPNTSVRAVVVIETIAELTMERRKLFCGPDTDVVLH